jgi:hypothetical protein
MQQVSEYDRIVLCELVGGGPLDGHRLQVEASRKILSIPVKVSDLPDTPGIMTRLNYSKRWVHCYVRLEADVFAYDGIRDLFDA